MSRVIFLGLIAVLAQLVAARLGARNLIGDPLNVGSATCTCYGEYVVPADCQPHAGTKEAECSQLAQLWGSHFNYCCKLDFGWENLTRTTGPCWDENQVQKDDPKAIAKFLDGCPNPLDIQPTKWVGHAGCKLWYDCSGLNTKAECNSNGPLCVWEKTVCVEDMALVLTFHFELFLVKCLADKCMMISAKRMDSIALSLEKAEFPCCFWAGNYYKFRKELFFSSNDSSRLSNTLMYTSAETLLKISRALKGFQFLMQWSVNPVHKSPRQSKTGPSGFVFFNRNLSKITPIN